MTINSPAMHAINIDDQLKLGLSAAINGSDIIQGKTYTRIQATQNITLTAIGKSSTHLCFSRSFIPESNAKETSKT